MTSSTYVQLVFWTTRTVAEDCADLHRTAVNLDAMVPLSSKRGMLRLGELNSSNSTRLAIGSVCENSAADRSNHGLEVFLEDKAVLENIHSHSPTPLIPS
jgi:hypothetical protein